jgi:hypothetical protein
VVECNDTYDFLRSVPANTAQLIMN